MLVPLLVRLFSRVLTVKHLGPPIIAAGLLAGASAIAKPAQPTIADRVEVEADPKNSGALRIRARLLVGKNACDATGADVSFSRRVEDRVLTLTPVRTSNPVRPKRCKETGRGLYRLVETKISAKEAAKSRAIVLENVERIGWGLDIRTLLATPEDPGQATLTGVLERVAAAGGESTGYALELDSGELVEVDLATHSLSKSFAAFEGRTTAVKGKFKTVTGTELSRSVLEARELSPGL